MVDHNVIKAVEILKWAIAQKKTLTQACKHFDASDKFLRNIRHRILKNKSHQIPEIKSFFKLYAEATNSTVKQVQSSDFDDNLKSGQKKFSEGSDGSASYEYKGSKMLTSLDDAIKFFKIDTRVWEVERFLCNSYPVSAREREQDLSWNKGVMTGHATRANKWTTTVNYQVKVWLRRKVEMAAAIEFEDFYAKALKKHSPFKYKEVKYPIPQEKNLLEVCIFDLHLGKLCWGKEVNNDYDMKIASRRFNQALHDLLARAKGQYERILFIVGNDFFNSDNHINTTTEGTRQDEDSRWQKVFPKGKMLLVEGIDYMRQFAPVDVLVIPGNHDLQKSFFLGETLAAWYRNDKNVSVNNSATSRKYYLYGKVLLGFTHGDKEHNGSLRMLMPGEAPRQWAKSKYREFHCGHWHRKVSYKDTVQTKVPLTDEQLGITVRHMSSLAGTDAWHYSKGFVGPIKAAEAFLWNDQYGLVGQFNSNIRK